MLSIFIGIGLSAACGFRVFVPLLGISLASLTGHLELAPGFEWIGSPLALIAFSTATLLEIAAYYIPLVDNFLDTIATPGAILAGTIITASLMGDSSPFFKWSLAVIGGGGSAGIVQGGMVLLRGTSSASTGGMGNPVVSTIELVSSIVTTFLAIILPVLAIILVFFILFSFLKKLIGLFFRKKAI